MSFGARRAAATLVAILAIAAAAAACGYLVGRASAEMERSALAGPSPARATAAGRSQAAAGGRAARGAHARRHERRRAYRAIRRRAFRRGRAAGRRSGLREGARRAFAGYPAGWEVGRWYAVRVGRSADGTRPALASRVPLTGDRAYHLCRRRRGALCGEVLPATPATPAPPRAAERR